MVASSENEAIAVIKDLAAGTVGGCGGIIAGQPLDTVKVRIQSPTTRGLYRGPIHCFLKIVTDEGPLALFKGMTSPLVGNAPMQAIVFGMNGNANRIMDKYIPSLRQKERDLPGSKPNFLRLYLAGTWAGIGQLSVCVPVELIKCKLQVQQDQKVKTFKGPWDCVRQIYQKSGVLGLYRGFWATFWRDAPSYGLYFVLYEMSKWRLSDKEGKNTMLSLLFSGGVAGIGTWLFTYPFDIVKSIIQTLPIDCPRHERTLVYQFTTNYRLNGYRFFTRGLSACIARAIPANAATFLLYELTLKFI
ncbi:hypothetical protein AAMO2058_001441900 [Amorphochlora amoebiformis]